jgi:hypothetical protein
MDADGIEEMDKFSNDWRSNISENWHCGDEVGAEG